MRKIFLSALLLAMLVVAGCANTANEKKIQEDLEADTSFEFLKQGEKIDELIIEKRQTDKKQKVDTIWCKVTTINADISYQKEVILTYGLYDKGRWILDDIDVNDDTKWIQKPLRGISEDKIITSMNGQNIIIDGETWDITNENVKDVVINKQETNLDEKTDIIIATVILDEEVEEAKGELRISYVFDDGWKVESISEENAFAVYMKPEVALEVSNEDLIDEVIKESFVLRSQEKQRIAIIYNEEELMHTVTIKSSEISNFLIKEKELSAKGTQQTYCCRFTLNKPNVTFEIEVDIPYWYISGKWHKQPITITPKCKTLNIVGEWTGIYYDAPYGGEAILNISDVNENGFITAVYSYFPEKEDKYTKPGSYNVSGTIDMSTLDIHLEAKDWINEPSDALSWTKSDISATLCVDEATIKGTGQRGVAFVVTQ